ncbi:hypothetical protein [Henriciella aquimarina]|uniref:hypothetical protein n=1 Tax=Henriciella aquimarina TaxID=545261 RepID=UPI0009FD943E|nr:hypothetical protein [Henriciella aquimarina]
MTGQTLQAMAYAAGLVASAFLIRAAFVMTFYTSWTLDELFGFNEGGWETEQMRERRRSFWR